MSARAPRGKLTDGFTAANGFQPIRPSDLRPAGSPWSGKPRKKVMYGRVHFPKRVGETTSNLYPKCLAACLIGAAAPTGSTVGPLCQIRLARGGASLAGEKQAKGQAMTPIDRILIESCWLWRPAVVAPGRPELDGKPVVPTTKTERRHRRHDNEQRDYHDRMTQT